MVEKDIIKTQYGWSNQLEEFFKYSNPILQNQHRGSFRIKEHNGKLFWYYRLSSDLSTKGRDKYLCSVEPKEMSVHQTSFQYCCSILLSKLQSNFSISERDKRLLQSYLQIYIDKIDSEGKSMIGRNSSTTRGMLTGLKDFKYYCVEKNLKLNIVPTNEIKNVLKDYINTLYLRSLARSSIKGYVQDVRYFLEWLVRDKLIGGLELFPSQPITLELQNKLIELICGQNPIKLEKVFRKEYYENCYRDCLEGVRDIWIDYCKNEGRLGRVKDKNGKINQPPHFIGREIVYFVSLLQLRGGFRVGEVLYSYRNRTIFNEFHLKTQPKEMGSFWEESSDGWILKIRNSKHKNREVPINDTIWSWDQPPEWIKFKKVKDINGYHYETLLVEVIMELFPSSFYTFPSPNYNEKPNGKRSITYYMNLFKDELVVKKGWDKYGVVSSHNLRSFFIGSKILF